MTQPADQSPFDHVRPDPGAQINSEPSAPPAVLYSLTFQFTADDYLALRSATELRGYVSRSDPNRIHVLVGLATGMCLYVFFKAWFNNVQDETVGIALLLLVFCTGYWWSAFKASKSNVRKQFEAESPLSGTEYHWQFDTAGVQVQIADIVFERIEWHGVTRCFRSRTGYFIDNHVTSSSWIPTRIFKTQLEELRFARVLQDHVPVCQNFKPVKCAHCGYDLRGSLDTIEEKCPECGR